MSGMNGYGFIDQQTTSLLHGVDSKDGFRPTAINSHDNNGSNHNHEGMKAHAVRTTAAALGFFQLFLFVLYGVTFAEWSITEDSTDPLDTDFSSAYSLFLGVEIMMFIGFGYLMTFLKEYGIGAIGLTMMVTVIGMQWSLFTEQFMYQLYHGHFERFSFSIFSLIEALYAVAAVLITFGGVIGKVTPLQLFILTIVELVFYSINNQIFLVGGLKLVDVGGTVIIHMFGAYFGLAVAYVLGNPRGEIAKLGYVPDMFAFIGTIFLWVYWPSFVCGALDDTGGAQQQRAIFNTILSLAASSTMAFSLSMWFSGKFRPVDIQNATLAGGVSIGAVANLSISPLIACLIGMLAGTISTIGFSKLQPYLENKFGLFDTCGIHNLHGMPSVLGGLASVIAAGYYQYKGRDSENAIYVDHPDNQWEYQLFGLIVTFLFAVTTGSLTGMVLKRFNDNGSFAFFKDESTWASD
jgi:ammonium transporter Rh